MKKSVTSPLTVNVDGPVSVLSATAVVVDVVASLGSVVVVVVVLVDGSAVVELDDSAGESSPFDPQAKEHSIGARRIKRENMLRA